MHQLKHRVCVFAICKYVDIRDKHCCKHLASRALQGPARPGRATGYPARGPGPGQISIHYNELRTEPGLSHHGLGPNRAYYLLLSDGLGPSRACYTSGLGRAGLVILRAWVEPGLLYFGLGSSRACYASSLGRVEPVL